MVHASPLPHVMGVKTALHEDSDETGCLAAVLLVPPVAAALIVCCYKVYSDINYHYQLGSYICSHELGIPYLLSS